MTVSWELGERSRRWLGSLGGFPDGLQVTGKGAKQRGLGRKGKKVEEQLDLRPSQNLDHSRK